MSDNISSELHDWIRRSRNGDAEAFSRIVDRFQAKVSAVTFSMTGNLQESEDIAQETFLVAWNKLAELTDPEKIGAWLCGIARTLCKKCFDRRRRDPLHAAAGLESNAVPEAESDETKEHRRELARLAWSAIETIPETYREPLVLFYRDGQSVRAVAETLQLTEDCVKQRLHRGRQYLRKEMEKTVESALESTRPDTAFTLAVLASIPLAAASGCTTATVGLAGGAGGLGSGGFGGGAGGMGFFGILLAVLAAVVGMLIQSASYIIFWLVYLWFLWQAIKNSPTARTRRFVIGASLDYAVLGIVLTGIERLAQPLMQQNFFSSDFYFWFGFVPLELRSFLVAGLPQYAVLAGFMLYVILRWRRLLYEDLTETDQSHTDQSRARQEAEESENPWHRVFQRERRLFFGLFAGCRRWLDSFLTVEGLKKKFYVVLGIVAVSVLFSQCLRMSLSYLAFSRSGVQNTFLVWFAMSLGWSIVLILVFQTVFFRMMWRGIRMSADEQAVEAAPPKFPAESWRTEAVLESLSPVSRRRVLVDALVLMAAIPLVIQLISVALGIARQTMDINNPYFMPLDWAVQTVVRLQIVLVTVAALYVSARPARRYAVFGLLFFLSGLVAFYYFERLPLLGVAIVGPLVQRLFWWLSMDGFRSPLPFWDEQKMYLFYHLLTLIGCGYLFFASAVCYVIHRVTATTGCNS